MTTAEFLALPDRERDALVAKYIFPEIRIRATCTGFDTDAEKLTWHYVPYTTDVAAAWEVLNDFGTWEIMGPLSAGGEKQEWRARVNGRAWVFTETAPLAICLAALKATKAIKDE